MKQPNDLIHSLLVNGFGSEPSSAESEKAYALIDLIIEGLKQTGRLDETLYAQLDKKSLDLLAAIIAYDGNLGFAWLSALPGYVITEHCLSLMRLMGNAPLRDNFQLLPENIRAILQRLWAEDEQLAKDFPDSGSTLDQAGSSLINNIRQAAEKAEKKVTEGGIPAIKVTRKPGVDEN